MSPANDTIKINLGDYFVVCLLFIRNFVELGIFEMNSIRGTINDGLKKLSAAKGIFSFQIFSGKRILLTIWILFKCRCDVNWYAFGRVTNTNSNYHLYLFSVCDQNRTNNYEKPWRNVSKEIDYGL